MVEESDAQKGIYDQDCQFYRYQDALMWGRFQTAATIEGAMLFGLYQSQHALPGLELKMLASAGSFVGISRLLAGPQGRQRRGKAFGSPQGV